MGSTSVVEPIVEARERLRQRLEEKWGRVVSDSDAEFIRETFGDDAVVGRPGRLALGPPPRRTAAVGLGYDAGGGDSPDDQVAGFVDDFSDHQNALLFVDDHADCVRFHMERGIWMLWTGTKWKPSSDEGEVLQLARDTAVKLTAVVAEEGNARQRKGAEALKNVRRQRDMLKLASGDPRLRIAGDAWDPWPWAFNTQTGTLDLHESDHMVQPDPHAPTDLITKVAPWPYDPTARCDRWLAFLDKVLGGDQEYIDYIQRVVGTCLIGGVDHQAMFFLYGSGANGKSVFVDLLLKMLGRDYAMTIPTEALMTRTTARAAYVEADIAGRFLIVASEVDQSDRLNEQRLKDLTSTEEMYARAPYGKPFHFKPQATLFLTGNHKPDIRGSDNGIWRRMRLLPFTVTIDPVDRDPNLAVKLTEEMPGILAWAVRGAYKVTIGGGLGTCSVVEAATETYRAESDRIGSFLEECCTVDPDGFVPVDELYQAYRRWAAESGERELAKNKFGSEMTRRGFESRKTSSGNGRIRTGLTLSAPGSGHTPWSPPDLRNHDPQAENIF